MAASPTVADVFREFHELQRRLASVSMFPSRTGRYGSMPVGMISPPSRNFGRTTSNSGVYGEDRSKGNLVERGVLEPGKTTIHRYGPYTQTLFQPASLAGVDLLDDASQRLVDVVANTVFDVTRKYQSNADVTRWPFGSYALSSIEMLFVIQYLQMAAWKGPVLEHDLGRVFGSILGMRTGPSQVLTNKRWNYPGPDAFFTRGGKALGLPFDAFSVEAKAGFSALDGALDMMKTEWYAEEKGTPKQRYRNYVTRFARGFQRDQFSTVLVTWLPTLDNPRDARLPGSWKTLYDMAVVINARGIFHVFK